MSRWWPERCTVLLGAREVRLQLSTPWRRSALAPEQVLPCPARVLPKPAWAPALQALEQLLADAPRRAGLDVLLSSHFVRLAVVPWIDGFTRDAERQAMARHRFERIHGEAAASWSVRLGEAAYGAPALACAVDQALLDALAELAAAQRRRLRMLQPLLAAAIDAHRRRLGPSFCLALVEPGRLGAGLCTDGQWQAVQVQRLAPAADAGVLLRRLLRSAGAAPALPVFTVAGESLQALRPESLQPWDDGDRNGADAGAPAEGPGAGVAAWARSA